MKKQNILLITGVALMLPMIPFVLIASRQNFGEYKTIRQIARIEMAPHATSNCVKYCDIKVIRIYQNYVLLSLTPDMKNCITDPIDMVMKNGTQGWKFVELGFSGDDQDSPMGFSHDIPKQHFTGVKK